jgi:hypothetical protein
MIWWRSKNKKRQRLGKKRLRKRQGLGKSKVEMKMEVQMEKFGCLQESPKIQNSWPPISTSSMNRLSNPENV